MNQVGLEEVGKEPNKSPGLLRSRKTDGWMRDSRSEEWSE